MGIPVGELVIFVGEKHQAQGVLQCGGKVPVPRQRVAFPGDQKGTRTTTPLWIGLLAIRPRSKAASTPRPKISVGFMGCAGMGRNLALNVTREKAFPLTASWPKGPGVIKSG